jgi:hypothetical protein
MRSHNAMIRKLVVLFAVSGLMIGAASLAAQERRGRSSFSRFSLVAAGGMGRTEEHQGLADLKLGVQYRLTSSLRLGLGLGYLKSEGRDGMRGNDRDASDGAYRRGDGRTAAGSDFRVLAATLDLVYALPVGRKWDLTIGGGAGRYFGEFSGWSEEVHRRVWGGQGGLGAEYRISSKLSAFAEAAYRFLEFHDIPTPVQMVPLTEVGDKLRPIVEMINYGLAMWIAPKPVDVRLNGPSFRIGLKFGL